MIESQKSVARLEARVDAAIKARWQQAADLQGITLTDFIITSLQESANKVIEQHQKMKLTTQESKAFVNAILNPAEPNENLKAAAAKHKEIMDDSCH